MPKLFLSRPLDQHGVFKKALEKTGLEIIGQSLIQFTPIPVVDIPITDWVFFYSKKGVFYFFEALHKLAPIQQDRLLKSVKWAVMGKGTAKALLQQNITIDFIGNGDPSTTAKNFQLVAHHQTVLFPRAKTSKQSIQKQLKEEISIVDLVVYNNQIKADFHIPFCKYLLFTSPLNVQAYGQKYSIHPDQKIIAIGATTAKALEKMGNSAYEISKEPTEQAMAEMVIAIEKKEANKHRFAVIDLGTNTFHLLVAQQQLNDPFKEIHRQRFFVKLAEKGIQTIGSAALKRGYHALETFRGSLDKLGITNLKAIGTAALRTASNGSAFIQQVKEKYRINIELIDGNREAELIYKGVKLAIPFKEANYLIMDIGGGSVEFIIADNKELLWAQSFPIGVAVLFKRFHRSNPISSTEFQETNEFLTNCLAPLYKALEKYPTDILVGASGTFDVLEYILAKEQKYPNHAFVDVVDFYPLFHTILRTTEKERYEMKNIPNNRADMIVVAIILINFILKKVGIKKIIVSNFALKEGMLSELMNGN